MRNLMNGEEAKLNVLYGEEATYITVPSSLILDKDLSDKRVAVYSYFMLKKGLDNTVGFSLDELIKWCGLKPNYHKGKANDSFKHTIEYFEALDYLDIINGTMRRSAYVEACINTNVILSETETFAVLYLDEILKILSYKKHIEHNITIKPSVVLLVFAYLRWKITRRVHNPVSNVVGEKYDLKYPDAYNCYYIDISKDIDISPRTISNAVCVLVELDLIYAEALDRVRVEKDRWITQHTIFANTYKREKDRETGNIVLVDCGKGYYSKEVRNKKLKLEKFKDKGER